MIAARRSGLLLVIAFGIGCTKAELASGAGGGSGGDVIQDGGSGGAPGTGGAGEEDAPVADDADGGSMDAPVEIAEDTGGPDEAADGNGVDADGGGAVDSSDGNDYDGPPPLRPTMVGQILVSELMANPAAVADDVGEWVEVYNPSSDVTYDLNGCSLVDNAAPPNKAPITRPFIMKPGSYHTIGRQGAVIAADFTQATVKFGNDHFDGAGIICGDVLITNFTYQPGDLVEGHTFSVDPSHLNASDYTLRSSWCLSNISYYMSGPVTDFGTPGKLNPPCPAGTF